MGKKATVKNIEKAIRTEKKKYVDVNLGTGEDMVTIPVRTSLSLTERSEMAQDIAAMVFHNDGSEEHYAPYLKKIAIDFNILNYFTDITLPTTADKVWDFVENTGIVNYITEAVGKYYIDSIIRDATELIDYKKNKLVRANKLDDLVGALKQLMNMVNNKFSEEDVDTVLEQVKEINPDFDLESLIKETVTAEALKNSNSN